MIHTPELATEVTLQPIDAFDMDAAILFSDILVTAEAMGLPLNFVDGVGPLFTPAVKSLTDMANLKVELAIEKLDYVMNAIRLCRHECDKRQKALLGFAGAPFTVACYMFRQKDQNSTDDLLRVIKSDIGLFHAVMEPLTQVTIKYLNAQCRAGVDAVQILNLGQAFYLLMSMKDWLSLI